MHFHHFWQCFVLCFFFNDTATTEIYTYLHTLSLHDALPIFVERHDCAKQPARHTASRLFSCIHSSYFGHGGSQIRQFYVVSSRSNQDRKSTRLNSSH